MLENAKSDSHMATEDILNMITFCEDDTELASKLRQLCRNYIDIFQTGLKPIPAKVSPMELRVDTTKWEQPTNRGPPRKLGPLREAEVNKQINEMLTAGVIEHSQASEYSQVMLTPKPNGEWRFCIDYRRLNDVTKRHSWPLPNPKVLLRRIGDRKPKRFGKLDFTKGYWQTPLAANKFTRIHSIYNLHGNIPMATSPYGNLWLSRLLPMDHLHGSSGRSPVHRLRSIPG